MVAQGAGPKRPVFGVQTSAPGVGFIVDVELLFKFALGISIEVAQRRRLPYALVDNIPIPNTVIGRLHGQLKALKAKPITARDRFARLGYAVAVLLKLIFQSSDAALKPRHRRDKLGIAERGEVFLRFPTVRHLAHAHVM